jgi:hypothetical protein
MRIVTSALLSLLLLVAACGGDSDDDAGSAGGGSVEEWCAFATDFEALGDEFDTIDPSDPDAIRTLFERADEALDRARNAAPSEISSEVGAFADSFAELGDAFEEVDFNIFDLDLSTVEDLTAAGDEANDTIEAFNERECGIEADDDEGSDEGSDDDFDPSAGTLREQLVDTFVAQGFTQEEASCIADTADLQLVASGDTSSLLQVFEDCGIDLTRLAELGG